MSGCKYCYQHSGAITLQAITPPYRGKRKLPKQLQRENEKQYYMTQNFKLSSSLKVVQ